MSHKIEAINNSGTRNNVAPTTIFLNNRMKSCNTIIVILIVINKTYHYQSFNSESKTGSRLNQALVHSV